MPGEGTKTPHAKQLGQIFKIKSFSDPSSPTPCLPYPHSSTSWAGHTAPCNQALSIFSASSMSLPVTPTLHHTELHTGPQTQLAFTHLRDFPNALPTPDSHLYLKFFPSSTANTPEPSVALSFHLLLYFYSMLYTALLHCFITKFSSVNGSVTSERTGPDGLCSRAASTGPSSFLAFRKFSMNDWVCNSKGPTKMTSFKESVQLTKTPFSHRIDPRHQLDWRWTSDLSWAKWTPSQKRGTDSKKSKFVSETTTCSACMLSCSVLSDFLRPHGSLQAPLSMEVVQARILERVAMPFCRGSSWPRDQP